MVALEVLVSKSMQEFVAALPPRWQDQIGPKRWRIITADAAAKSTGHSRGAPVALAVPVQDFLVRRIELPLASRFQLANLMQFEAPRHVPLPLESACLDFRIVHNDISASRTVVELAIIRREAVEADLQQAATAGIKIEAIYLQTSNGPWLARRPVALDWRQRWLSRRQQVRYLQFGIPILLFLLWVLAAQSWATRLAEQRDAAELVARTQAAGVEPLRLQLTALNDKIGYLASIRKRASAAAVTEEIARLLPDDAWLQELDLEDQTVRMLGTAQNATDLLRDFSASALFTNVQFEAPLTQAIGVQGDQFDILMSRR